jgi:hypothetical protein
MNARKDVLYFLSKLMLVDLTFPNSLRSLEALTDSDNFTASFIFDSPSRALKFSRYTGNIMQYPHFKYLDLAYDIEHSTEDGYMIRSRILFCTDAMPVNHFFWRAHQRARSHPPEDYAEMLFSYAALALGTMDVFTM